MGVESPFENLMKNKNKSLKIYWKTHCLNPEWFRVVVSFSTNQQTTNNKQETSNNKQQATNNKQQTTNNKQQTTNN